VEKSDRGPQSPVFTWSCLYSAFTCGHRAVYGSLRDQHRDFKGDFHFSFFPLFFVRAICTFFFCPLPLVFPRIRPSGSALAMYRLLNTPVCNTRTVFRPSFLSNGLAVRESSPAPLPFLPDYELFIRQLHCRRDPVIPAGCPTGRLSYHLFGGCFPRGCHRSETHNPVTISRAASTTQSSVARGFLALSFSERTWDPLLNPPVPLFFASLPPTLSQPLSSIPCRFNKVALAVSSSSC